MFSVGVDLGVGTVLEVVLGLGVAVVGVGATNDLAYSTDWQTGSSDGSASEGIGPATTGVEVGTVVLDVGGDWEVTGTNVGWDGSGSWAVVVVAGSSVVVVALPGGGTRITGLTCCVEKWRSDEALAKSGVIV